MRKDFQILVLAASIVLLSAMPAFAQSLFYADNPSSIATAQGGTLEQGTAMVTGQANVQSITVSGASSVAGDTILIYDATSATGTPKFDITVGTAKETIVLKLNDAEFGTGLFADANTPGLHISVEYTQQ